jgi:hypothetical protein
VQGNKILWMATTLFHGVTTSLMMVLDSNLALIAWLTAPQDFSGGEQD